jgi:hypothetical protein
VASAIRLYMLMKNWLNKKKIRKNDFNSTDSNNIYRDRNNEKTIPLAEKIKNTRETLDQRFLTYSEAERRPCVALLLHSHVTSLGGYISSLFGCEEWLRKKIRFLLASEALAETFSLWYVFIIFPIFRFFFAFAFAFSFLFDGFFHGVLFVVIELL